MTNEDWKARCELAESRLAIAVEALTDLLRAIDFYGPRPQELAAFRAARAALGKIKEPTP
jgi:hypothetical protein